MPDDGEDVCPICHESYDEGQNSKIVLEGCNHGFHSACIIKWFRAPTSRGACPLCRGSDPVVISRMTMNQRCTHLRRRARGKSAPTDLKKRVERLKAVESEMKDHNREKKAFYRREDVKEILTTAKRFNRCSWNHWCKVRKAKANVAIFRAPGYDPPSFVEEDPVAQRRRVTSWPNSVVI